METPVPEEQVVGAARLNYFLTQNNNDDEEDVNKPKTVVIDIFSYFPDDTVRSVRSQMLAQIERIAVGQGAEIIIIEVYQHRIDIQAWLEDNCGYKELGGHICEEKGLLKPTMVFEFHKNLLESRAQSVSVSILTSNTTTNSNSNSTNTPPGELSVRAKGKEDNGTDNGTDNDNDNDHVLNDKFDLESLSLEDFEIISDSNSNSNSNAADPKTNDIDIRSREDPMRGLMGNLFAALHKEMGDDANANANSNSTS
jgi:hypothetical protein